MQPDLSCTAACREPLKLHSKLCSWKLPFVRAMRSKIVPSRRKNSGGGMPAANGRLIEGGYRIVNAANVARQGQISGAGLSKVARLD